MCFKIIHVALSNSMIQTSVIGIDTSFLNIPVKVLKVH